MYCFSVRQPVDNFDMCCHYFFTRLFNIPSSVPRHCGFKVKQESPLAWTQEAYRKPRSNCSLCRGGVYPISGRGGYPVSGLGEGGYPISGLGGTPSQVLGGYPLPGLGGTLSQVWGVPHSDLVGGTPGTPLSRPRMGTPHLDLGWGTLPLARPGMGYPLTWDGVPPLRPDWGPPPTRDVNWQTNWKQYLPPILRMRAVKIEHPPLSRHF